VTPLFWIWIAPLLWALARCGHQLAREGELRLLPGIGLLLALGLTSAFWAPTGPLDPLLLLGTGQLEEALAGLAANSLAAVSVAAHGRSLRERNRAERRLARDLDALRDLAEATLKPGTHLERDLEGLLRIGCRALACDVGLLARIDGAHWELRAASGTIDLEPGDRLPLAATFCAAALREPGIASWNARRPAPPGNDFDFDRCLSLAIRSGDEAVGSLCFGRRGRGAAAFSATEMGSLGLVAQAITTRWLGDAEGPRVSSHPVASEIPVGISQPEPLAPTLVALDAEVRKHESTLRAELPNACHLSLQLDDEGAILEIRPATFATVLFTMVRQAGERMDCGVLTIESSQIEAETEDAPVSHFATLSVHAPADAPNALELEAILGAHPGLHPETPSFEELRDALKAHGGDLSIHSAKGVGVTLTAFFPLAQDPLAKPDESPDREG